MSNDNPDWGTVKQAAARKSVSTFTIRRWITAGLVQAERVGPKLIRVNFESLDHMGTDIQGRD